MENEWPQLACADHCVPVAGRAAYGELAEAPYSADDNYIQFSAAAAT